MGQTISELQLSFQGESPIPQAPAQPVFALFRCTHSLFLWPREVVLEHLAPRQQRAVLKRQQPRPRLDLFDKLSWVLAHQVWSTGKEALIVVPLEMVAHGDRAGFRFCWRLISRPHKPAGRRRLSKEVRELIPRTVFSSSVTTVEASCTSTSRSTQRAVGSFSSYGRHFPSLCPKNLYQGELKLCGISRKNHERHQGRSSFAVALDSIALEHYRSHQRRSKRGARHELSAVRNRKSS